jgi:hypothetical protein
VNQIVFPRLIFHLALAAAGESHLNETRRVPGYATSLAVATFRSPTGAPGPDHIRLYLPFFQMLIG